MELPHDATVKRCTVVAWHLLGGSQLQQLLSSCFVFYCWLFSANSHCFFFCFVFFETTWTVFIWIQQHNICYRILALQIQAWSQERHLKLVRVLLHPPLLQSDCLLCAPSKHK